MDMKLNIAVLEATDAHAPASICLPWGCTYSPGVGSYLDYWPIITRANNLDVSLVLNFSTMALLTFEAEEVFE